MYSTTVKYIKGTDFTSGGFRNVVNALYVAIAVTCVLIFSKYAFKRKKSTDMFPSRKLRILDIMGTIADILFVSRVKGLPSNDYVLQAITGLQQLFKKEKFYLIWMFYSPFVVITKAEAVEKIISGSKHLQKNFVYAWLRPWLGTGLLTSSGGKWKSRRKLLTPSFHFDILKDFLPVFNEQSQYLVKFLEKEVEKPWIDVIKPIALCALDIICETTLGVSVGAQKDSESEYVQAVGRAAGVAMERLVHPPYFLDWYFALSKTGIQFKKDVKLLHDFTRKAISEKKQKLLSGEVDMTTKKRKALMDLLLEQHIKNKSITEEDIREEIHSRSRWEALLRGQKYKGHDTTSMGVTWALYLIGLHKHVQYKIHEELDRIFGNDVERPVTIEDLRDMEYLDCVLKKTTPIRFSKNISETKKLYVPMPPTSSTDCSFEESLRLFPSVPFFARTLDEDVTIDEYTLPKGYSVTIVAYCIHRDETVFPNPEVFDPERFLPENTVNRHPFAYIPFSAGPRNCIGQRFALMEEKVVVANVLRNYSIESLDSRDKILLLSELILRAAGPIRMKFKLRRL